MRKKEFAKKATSWLLSMGMVVSSFAGICLVDKNIKSAQASTASSTNFVGAAPLDNSTSGRTLGSSGKINHYVVGTDADTKFTGSNGANGLTIASNATVVIEIKSGYKLTCIGGNSYSTAGAGAGIYVPSNSKLYIIGEGTLVAQGGNAASGGNGSGGLSASGTDGDDYMYGGSGGSGGYGGGGAGAGIGTSGGTGGTGGAGGSGAGKTFYDGNYKTCVNVGQNGTQGNIGGSSSSMGSLYVLGSVIVTASGGSYGSGGGYGSNNAYVYSGTHKKKEYNQYGMSGSGGGGAGGGGGYRAAAIGSGGSGGSGGGGGGGGAAYQANKSWTNDAYVCGFAGYAGAGETNGSANYRSSRYGGAGGAGGSVNSSGNGGSVYRASGTSVSSSGGTTNSYTGNGASSTTYASLIDTISLVDAGTGLAGATKSDWGSRTSTGYAQIAFADTKMDMSSMSLSYSHTGYTLDGWYTAASGGEKIIDANGTVIAKTNYTAGGKWNCVSNTLYAHWEQKKYTITVNANSGYNGGTLTAEYDTIMPGISVSAGRTGYQLLGYYDQKTGGNLVYDKNGAAVASDYDSTYNSSLVYTNDSNMTVYAHWTANKYTVRFWTEDENENTIFLGESDELTYGSFALPDISEYDVSKNHYNFKGWNIYSSQDWSMYKPNKLYTGGLTTGTEPVDAYASWEMQDSYVISYQANGGKNAPIMGYAFLDENYTLSSQIPTRDNYTFVGWSRDPEAETASYQAGEEVEGIDTACVLYAVWAKNNSVSYNTNGGVVDTTIDSSYPARGDGATVTDVEPYRTGYTFEGWSTDKDATEATYHANDTVIMSDHAIVLYAVWSQEKYRVDFDYDNELCSVVKGDDDNYSTQITDNYAMVGYGDNYSFCVKYPKYINGNNITVTAGGALLVPVDTKNNVEIDGVKYTVKKYTLSKVTQAMDVSISGLEKVTYSITYHAKGGVLQNSTSSYSGGGSEDITLSVPAYTGYTFGGWYTDSSCEGEAVAKIAASEYGNKEYWAKWTAVSYKITYNENKTNGDTVQSDDTYNYDQYFELKTDLGFTNGTYNFLGWSTDKNATRAEYTDGQEVKNLVTKDDESGDYTGMTLYAVWQIPSYTVMFDANGGDKVPDSITAVGGSALDLSDTDTYPQPSKTGYTFAGWTTGGNTYTGEYTVTKNVVLEAKWTPGDYTITYNSNVSDVVEDSDAEGNHLTGNMEVQSGVRYGDRVTLESNEYVYTHLTPAEVSDGEEEPTITTYKFLGWSKTAGGSVDYVDGQKVGSEALVNNAVSNNITLYAIWGTAEQYYVTYDANGGTGSVATQQLTINAGEVGEDPTIDPVNVQDGTTLSKTGYTFAGWSLDPDAESATYVKDILTTFGPTEVKNYTLYAVWTPIEYTIVYQYYDPASEAGSDADEDSVPLITSEQTFKYGEKVTLKDCTDIEGWTVPNLYKFAGWTYKSKETSTDTGEVDSETGEPIINVENEEIICVNGMAIDFTAYADEATKKLTLTTSWVEDPDAVQLSYDANGGDGMVPYAQYYSKNYTADIDFTDENMPTRSGYTFEGWSTSHDAATPEYTADGDKEISMDKYYVLYAVWQETEKANVVYDAGFEADADDVSVPFDSSQYQSGSSVPVSFEIVPSKMGYTFIGWDTTENVAEDNVKFKLDDGNDQTYTVTDADTTDGTITFCAQWKQNEYTVSYYMYSDVTGSENAGTYVTNDTFASGNNENLKSVSDMSDIVAPAGYEFAGWSLTEGGGADYTDEQDINFTDVSDGADIKLYTVWEPITIQMSLDPANGESLETVTFKYGQILPELSFAKPARSGYKFLGFYDGTGNNATQYYDEDMNPVRRWNGSDPQVALTAKWLENTITLHYCTSDGDNVYDQTFTNSTATGNLKAINVLTRNYGYEIQSGKAFYGWTLTFDSSDVDLVDEASLSELEIGDKSEIYIYGVVLSDTKCYIHYNNNGGTGGPSGYKAFSAGQSAKINFEDKPTKAGYVFEGWSTDMRAGEASYYDEDGNNRYQTSESEQFVELYAVWSVDADYEEDYSSKTLMSLISNTYVLDCEVGDSPDISDLVITALYTDGSTRTISSYTTNVDSLDYSKAGIKKMIISYAENDVTKVIQIPINVVGSATTTAEPTAEPTNSPITIIVPTVGPTESPIVTESPIATETPVATEEPQDTDKPDQTIDTTPTVSPSTSSSISVNDAAKLISSTNTDKGDVKGSEFRKIRLKAVGAKASIKLNWNKVKGATGYVVYGSTCGKAMQKIAVVKSLKYTVKKLKKGKFYKYMVVAYNRPSNTAMVLSMSTTIHAVTKGGKYNNPTKIVIKKSKKSKAKLNKLSLKKNKKKQLVVKVTQKKKLAVHIAKVRYESSNKKIVTVTKKGKIKAKKKGTAYLYAYTQNGLYQRVKVTVK